MTIQKRMVLAGSLVMVLVVLLMPLVNLMSYRFGLFELPHKIERLVDGTGAQVIGFVLLAALVISPLVLGVLTWVKGRAPKVVVVLPLCFSAVLTILLLVAKKPDPGIGLWVYLCMAAVVAVDALRKEKS
ncbi:MAG: hypothetical protein K5683_01800 [Prevotella sp.]|nr:hypothetical protein [Prevotella sp.]